MDNTTENERFSYNGYQVVRGEFFAHIKEPSITFNNCKVYGFHILNRVLLLCIGTWEGDCNSLSGNILSGVSHLVAAFGDTLKDDIFKEKLSRISVKEILRTAKERRNGSIGYAEAILFEYNKRMKNPLKIGKLRKFELPASHS